MPLVRYDTGDKGKIIEAADGARYLEITGGRKHDFINFDGLKISSSSIQDELSRINNVYEFQILVDNNTDKLEIVLDTDNKQSFEDAKNLLLRSLPENTIFRNEEISNFVMSGSHDKFQRIIYKSYFDYADSIKAIYEKHLGRKPDEEGYAHYSKKLKEGMTIDQIEKIIKDSNEYKNIN